MKITNISYPTELNSLKDIKDDNIDIFVESCCNNTKKPEFSNGK